MMRSRRTLMRSRRTLVLPLVLVMLLIFTSACGALPPASSATPSPSTEASASTEDSASERTEETGDERAIKDGVYLEGYPLVDEKVTIKVLAAKAPFLQKEYEDMLQVKNYEELTNVHVEWEAYPNDVIVEKKNLILASGDLPDAFGYGVIQKNDIVKYGPFGLFAAVEELSEFTPELERIFTMRPQYRKGMTTEDGHIYMFPHASEYIWTENLESIFLNQVWLDKLGLDVPTNTSEFKDMLISFRDNDMDGDGDTSNEIPFTFRMADPVRFFGSMFGLFGRVKTPNNLVMENDVVVYAPAHEEYKEAIKWFHDLYEEKLFDPEGFTHDLATYRAKTNNLGNDGSGILGAFTEFWLISAVPEEAWDTWTVMPPLKGIDGKQVWGKIEMGLSSTGYVISASSEIQGLAARWGDTMYDMKNSIEWSHGPIGVNFEVDDNGVYHLMDVPEGMDYEQHRHLETPATRAPNFMVLIDYRLSGIIQDAPKDVHKKALHAVYEPYLLEECYYPSLYMSQEDQSTTNTISTDLNEYVNTMTSSWIINGGVEEEWDAFIAQLDKMQLDTYLDILQKNYDRFLNN